MTAQNINLVIGCEECKFADSEISKINRTMKIEERYKCTSKECSAKCPLYHPDAKICLQHFAIKYAKEQSKIDIDKACEWLTKYAIDYADIEPLGKGDVYALVYDFRKAMEEM